MSEKKKEEKEEKELMTGPGLYDFLESKSESDKIDLIEDFVQEMFFDKVPKDDRDIIMWTGKGGAANQVKLIKEEFGQALSEEEKQEIEDSFIDGMYEINSKNIYPLLQGWYTDSQDGHFIAQKWAREDDKGNQFGVKYFAIKVNSGWAGVIKELTKEEFDEAKDND